jgi:putative colanic acid biosynthesis acetyltransferase WcaF
MSQEHHHRNGGPSRQRIQVLREPRIGDRGLRLVWKAVWLLLGRPTPVVMHPWRCMLLRIFGARIERMCYVYPSAAVWAPWNLQMHEGSCLAAGVDCYNVAPITLHCGVTVSQRSFLCTASHDFDVPSFPLVGGEIVIERQAWVAAEAFVGPGVRVGERSVILARAVVVRDTAPNAVVGGNPAKELRNRSARRSEEGVRVP